MESDNFCLRLSGFQDNLNDIFGNLRSDKEFNDVTLVCEDGSKLEAHKMILSASSLLFNKLLTREKHAHPMIFMVGVKSGDLVAVLNLIYLGQANVNQESLDSFLTLAHRLQLKGKMDILDDKWKRDQDIHPTPLQIKNNISLKVAGKLDLPKGNEFASKDNSKDLSYLESEIQSRMEIGQSLMFNNQNKIFKAHVCKVCGKEGMKNDIKRHIEATHVEGLSITCNLCQKTHRSRQALWMHKKRFHSK